MYNPCKNIESILKRYSGVIRLYFYKTDGIQGGKLVISTGMIWLDTLWTCRLLLQLMRMFSCALQEKTCFLVFQKMVISVLTTLLVSMSVSLITI